MRIVKAYEPDRPEFQLVNGDVVEPIACYETRAKADACALTEKSRRSGYDFKVVLNADAFDLVGQVIA